MLKSVLASIGFFLCLGTVSAQDLPTQEIQPPLAQPTVPSGVQKEPKAHTEIELPLSGLHKKLPNWGFQLSVTPNAFGGKALVVDQGTTAAFGFTASFQYQPNFIHSFGVLGIGPSVSVYPIFGASVTQNNFSLYSGGFEIRYQLRYFKKQIFVPMVGYSAEYFVFSFLNGMKGHTVAKGPIFGLWILLNAIEPSAASDFYIDYNVLRTYLTLEARNIASGDGSPIQFSGYSYYAGLRIEF